MCAAIRRNCSGLEPVTDRPGNTDVHVLLETLGRCNEGAFAFPTRRTSHGDFSAQSYTRYASLHRPCAEQSGMMSGSRRSQRCGGGAKPKTLPKSLISETGNEPEKATSSNYATAAQPREGLFFREIRLLTTLSRGSHW